MNEIDLVAHGPVTELERQTAAHLIAEGDPRWLVAAKLGRFPLLFDGTGRKPTRATSRPRGKGMTTYAARRDPRQFALYDLFAAPKDDAATG